MPVNDLVVHEETDCPCGPSVEFVAPKAGGNGWLVVHNSLDRREAHE